MLNARMQTYLETEKKVLASGIELKYLPDEYLFRKGQKAEFVFYVQSGGLLFEWPNEKKIITITQVPFFIGIDEVLSGTKYTCHAQTTEFSEFLVFERAYFLMLLNEFEDALPYFLQKEAEFIQLKKENKPDLYSV
jgi:CRP-like cAMP-binding protein